MNIFGLFRRLLRRPVVLKPHRPAVLEPYNNPPDPKAWVYEALRLAASEGRHERPKDRYRLSGWL